MSDNIPFDIQVKIIKKLPVKSLIQFRSVSKPWKTLIDSSTFIASYHIQQQQQHVLVRYADPNNSNYEGKYVSIVDDNTFPQHKFTLTRPIYVGLRKEPSMVSSEGLFCWYYGDEYLNFSKFMTVVIWNPAIRKSVSINDIPNVLDPCIETFYGFGVLPITHDPTLVRVAFDRKPGKRESDPIVEVFTLSTRVWRSLSINLPRKSLVFTHNQVAIGRFIYWLVSQRIHADAGLQWYDLIMSFDMTTDEFTEIYLPDSLALNSKSSLYIHKLRESLVVVQSKREATKVVYYVLKMIEHGVQKSFIELFTINTPDASIEHVHGFRTSGEPIVEVINDRGEDALFVYEPNSRKISYTGITAKRGTCFVIPYMETLLLLDH